MEVPDSSCEAAVVWTTRLCWGTDLPPSLRPGSFRQTKAGSHLSQFKLQLSPELCLTILRFLEVYLTPLTFSRGIAEEQKIIVFMA